MLPFMVAISLKCLSKKNSNLNEHLKKSTYTIQEEYGSYSRAYDVFLKIPLPENFTT